MSPNQQRQSTEGNKPMSQLLSLLQSCVCPMVRETQQTFEQMNGKYTLQRFHANYTC